MTQKRIAIFPGSFDPFTLGHLDITERAARIFDEVIISVGIAQGKHCLFTAEERQAQIQTACQKLANVKVATFDGLAVEHAKSVGATTIVRGLRSTSDYNYEIQMCQMNRNLNPNIDTILILKAPEFGHISSSLTKEIAHHNGDVISMVPHNIAEDLTKKFSK